LGSRRKGYIPTNSPLLTPQQRRKRERDLQARLKDPINAYWKVFMQVPRALRVTLRDLLIKDVAPYKIEDYDWRVTCYTLANKCLVLAIGVHTVLDRTFSKQYDFEVDPDRKLRDGMNRKFLKGQ
jgi:hypothetical protein